MAFQKKKEINKRLGLVEDEDNNGGEGQEQGADRGEGSSAAANKKAKGKKKAVLKDVKGNIGDRQTIITEILRGMTKAEKDDLERAVKDWNEQRPPPDVQEE